MGVPSGDVNCALPDLPCIEDRRPLVPRGVPAARNCSRDTSLPIDMTETDLLCLCSGAVFGR